MLPVYVGSVKDVVVPLNFLHSISLASLFSSLNSTPLHKETTNFGATFIEYSKYFAGTLKILGHFYVQN